MSELALIQKAIEESQQKMTQLFDAQKTEIEKTGVVSKQSAGRPGEGTGRTDQIRYPPLRS